MKKLTKSTVKDCNNLEGYIFIAPWIIGFLIFFFVPMIQLLYYSFTDFNLLSAPHWVGLDNFKRMFFNDSKIWKSLTVTFFFVFASVIPRLVFALFVAIRLNQKHRFIGVYRTIYYLPSILGGSVAVAVMWRQVFSSDGVLNSLLRLIGIDASISYIGNPNTAIWTLVLLAIWQFGSSMLIFLAGLKNIPVMYYEAASMDGANSWQKFYRITLPLLSPVILFNLIMQIINGFMTFTQGYIITEGGPIDSTLFWVLYMYKRGFEFYDMGYASAMAWVMLFIVAIFTVIIFKTSNSWVHYESKGE